MLVRFWKFSTAGNTTIFTDHAGTARIALGLICAEQAGHANLTTHALTMAGGEFCANACLAFAALLELNNLPVRDMTIAGHTTGLEIAGKFPDWHCAARFSMPKLRTEATREGQLCHLTGISHKFIECREFPESATALQMAGDMARTCASQAAGIIWWRRTGEVHEILPAIAVPQAGTCNLEQACGSASIALAALLPGPRHSIRQPSGEILTVQKDHANLLLSGRVQYQASGEMWIAEKACAAADDNGRARNKQWTN